MEFVAGRLARVAAGGIVSPVSNLLPLLIALAVPSAVSQELPEDEPEGRERSVDELPDAPLLPAEHGARVLVSEFQALDEGSGAFAALLRTYLAGALLEVDGLDVVEVEDAPDFGEHSALVYLQSCPAGEFIGCALVVGQRVDADYSVTGTVVETARGNRVDISVINVPESREALAFSLEVEVGDDQVFISGVVDLLLAVIEGEAGITEDVRDEDDSAALKAAQREMNAELAAQLGELKDELGDVSEVRDLSDTRIDRPKYSLDDLTEDFESEGSKPWERVGMTPTEYLRYKNSGMTLLAWRQASMGKKGKLFLRGGGGFTRGPVDSHYYARYALESAALTTVESYAWQAVETGSGGTAGIWLGYGLLPTLELDLGGGLVTGRFEVEVYQDIVARSDPADPSSPYEITLEDDREGEDYNGGGFWVGGRVMAGLFPVSKVRPLLGGGVTYTFMSAMPVQVPSDVPTFPASTALQAQVLGGVEASAGDLFDFYAAIPVAFLVGGRVSQSESDGLEILDNTEPAASPGLVSASVEVGVAIKLFGAKVDQTRSRMDFDLEDY